MKVKYYRKKPVIIEAIKLNKENIIDVLLFVGNVKNIHVNDEELIKDNILANNGIDIQTLEGVHHASWGDYIIKGIKGEFYPCKPDIFLSTYEEV